MSTEDGMKICAVIVTYGNRYHLLKESIKALLEQQIFHIIVVDNHSNPPSHEKLKNLENNLSGKLKVIHLAENTGSAGGYRRGMQDAYACKNCEFIWLLDDDNKPKEGALKALIEFWFGLEEEDKEHRIALMSYRADREIYKEVILKNKPNLIMGRKNSFLGFHMCETLNELFRRIKIRYFRKIDEIDLFKKKYGRVSAVPFGGMFFHKTLLNNIGYPNQDLFLYADDWDFSYRITNKGGKIILLLNSVIEDLEKSWHRKNKESLFKIYLLEDLEDFRLYYYVRNRVYFERKYLVENPVVYFFNKLKLLSIVGLFGAIKKRNNIRIIRKAIRDGNKGKLGRFEC
jgi:GT2 family glycosyltransferase